ncbi:winged helix-turn-helix domain-containing protein [Streptomyces scabiei]|uniref:helix-turn-helix domain-containing protein n=1 Tax=Streptomyces scabiei TaxID=1930 RepID=UPI0038F7A763
MSVVAPEVAVLAELWVPDARQWLSSSTGRIATEGYSWMQAVHWVAGSGLYQPRRHRSSGLRSFNATTVYIAQLLAELSPCFPGLTYLQRRTGLSERAVEYHLAALRETGLLAYIVKGTRKRGESPQASEFARMIPVEFDEALGIRTKQHDQDEPACTRVMTGIAEAGRELMARLARKAARKVRRPRSKTSAKAPARGARKGSAVAAISAGSRCTPMGGGSSIGSSAGGTYSPPESKLASGKHQAPTPKKSTAMAGPRKLNRVGRRFQLARELTRELDWLHGCSVPRIAWVARNVADAGWSMTDVRAWLHLRGEATRVRRGSGLLAVLLSNAVTVLDTPAKRAEAVAQWRGAQEAARRDRIQQVRAQRERFESDWQAPSNRAVTHQVAKAFAQVHEVANGGPRQHQAPRTDDQCEDLGLTAPQMKEMRAIARGELMRGVTDLIDLAVDSMGREAAEHLYGADLVRRARQLATAARSSLMTITHR